MEVPKRVLQSVPWYRRNLVPTFQMEDLDRRRRDCLVNAEHSILRSRNSTNLPKGCLALMALSAVRGSLSPMTFSAITRNSYSWPSSRPRTVAVGVLMKALTFCHLGC